MQRSITILLIILLASAVSFAEAPQTIEGKVVDGQIRAYTTPLQDLFDQIFSFTETDAVSNRCIKISTSSPYKYVAGTSNANVGLDCAAGDYFMVNEISSPHIVAKRTRTEIGAGATQRSITYYPLFANLWRKTQSGGVFNFKNYYTRDYTFNYEYICYHCTFKGATLQEKSCVNKNNDGCVKKSEDSCNQDNVYDFEQQCLDHLIRYNDAIRKEQEKVVPPTTPPSTGGDVCAQVETKYFVISNNRCVEKTSPTSCIPEKDFGKLSDCEAALTTPPVNEQCQSGDTSPKCTNVDGVASPPTMPTGVNETSQLKQEIYKVTSPKIIKLDDSAPALKVSMVIDKAGFVEAFYVKKGNPWYDTYLNLAGGSQSLALFSFLGIEDVTLAKSCPEDFERKQTLLIKKGGDVTFKMTPPLPQAGDVFGKEKASNFDGSPDYLLVLAAFEYCGQTPSEGGIRVSKVTLSPSATIPDKETPKITCDDGLDNDQDGNLDDFPTGAGDSDCAAIVQPKDFCNKADGEYCVLPEWTAGDDSQQSLECDSGWCSDVAGTGAFVGTGAKCSKPPFGKIAHQQCVPTPTSSELSSFKYCSLFDALPDSLGSSKCTYGSIGGIIILLILFRIMAGGK